MNIYEVVPLMLLSVILVLMAGSAISYLKSERDQKRIWAKERAVFEEKKANARKPKPKRNVITYTH